MTQSKKTFSVLLGGLLVGGLSLPGVSSGAQSCTIASLSGTYNASVQSANFQSVIQRLAPPVAPGSAGTGPTGTVPTGNTGTTGSTGSLGTDGPTGVFGGPITTGGPGMIGGVATPGNNGPTTTTPPTAPAAAATTGGLGGNPASLSGSIPGLGRYSFDGNGSIVGLGVANGVSQSFNSAIGSYSVNADCTARLSLGTGQTFDGVIVESGDQVLFVETDPAGGGAVGTLQRSRNTCTGGEVPNSIGFSLFGAQTATAATGSTGAISVIPYGAIGEVNLQQAGTFNMAASVVQNGAIQRVTGAGTYAVGTDCSIKLTLTSSTQGANTGAVSALLPLAFRGLLSSEGHGVLTLVPAGGTLVTGSFVVQ